jgi:resuscitation-promoting factor RpfB
MVAAPPAPTPAPDKVTAGRGRVGARLRRSLALLLVLGMAVPFLLAADRVRLEVDGEAVAMRTYVSTVDGVLDQAGVEVGPHDLVVPPLDAPVDDGMQIQVRRAVPVTVVAADGAGHVVLTPARTVAEVLAAVGEGRVPGGVVLPALDAPIERGLMIKLIRPVAVTVHTDGVAAHVTRRGGRVADALAAADVAVGSTDVVIPPLSTPLIDGLEIHVRRVGAEEAVEQVTLPFSEQVVETAARYKGERVVVQEGAEGLRIDTYRLRTVDGVVMGRDLVSQEVVREPRPRIVEVGTKERPVAPTVPSGSVWDRLAQCESHGNWAMRGTYHGGLQFHPDTWNRWKPAGYPDYAYEATREQQIVVGERLHAARGWAPWPHCSSVLGLR